MQTEFKNQQHILFVRPQSLTEPASEEERAANATEQPHRERAAGRPSHQQAVQSEPVPAQTAPLHPQQNHQRQDLLS
jgi:hypothetical protein